MTASRLALEWRINKLKGMDPSKCPGVIYTWIQSKQITRDDFKELMELLLKTDKSEKHQKLEKSMEFLQGQIDKHLTDMANFYKSIKAVDKVLK